MREFTGILSSLGDRVSTPAPIVLLEVLQSNIEAMQTFADSHGKQLRPHVKTHKSVKIAQLQLAAGAAGLTVGNFREAEIFAAMGCPDILFAYPIWPDGEKASRLRPLAQQTRLTVGIESRPAVDTIARAMGDQVSTLGVVVEIDCGAGRSGVAPDAAGALAAYAREQGLAVRGVFTYPGHGGVAGAREQASEDQARALNAAVESLREYGIEAEIVSAGSTPTAEYCTDPVITEIRPGEYVFNDHDNFRIGDCQEDQIALFVASTVVSDQGHPHVIVDSGTKALAREGSPERGYGRVPAYDGVLSKLNEYHGFLALPEGGTRPEIGERVAIVPHHVCPVVNSFEELIIVDGTHQIVDRWPVDAQGQLN